MEHTIWPNSGLTGQLSQELALPVYFEPAVELVTPDRIEKQIPCGPDPAPNLERITAYANAGFTHLYLHQVGPDQDGFMEFAKREILPQAQAIG